MHNSKSLVRMFTTLAVISGVLAGLALSASGALAQIAATESKKYLMTSSGTWGAAQDAAIANVGGNVDYRHAASGIGIASSDDPRFLMRAMRSGLFGPSAPDMMVQWQEPNTRFADDTFEEEVVTPGDETFINEQWNIVAIDAAGAWASGYTGAGARVAVLDGGIHSTHVDLDGNLDVARSTSFVPGFAFNQDAGTFWHGTHVAGIVAAEDNGIGTIGVAPGATIIGVKVLHNGSGSFGQVISGILYAADAIADGGAGANIINMSLGATFAKGGGNTGAGPLVAAMNKAVNYATERNVLVVTSAGNSAIDMDHAGNVTNVPAQSGSAIAISATGPVGYAVGWPAGAQNFRRPASYTNYGNSLVWVAAPGGDFVLPGNALCSIPRCCGGTTTTNCWVHDMVMSTVRGSGASITSYGWAAGTSMAAPAASGVAALVVEKFPGISVGDLKSRLAQTADDEGDTSHDPYYGRGFVNANRAVNDGSAAQQAAKPSPKQETIAAAAGVELAVLQNGGRTAPSISFSLPSAGPARVDLFDLAGRRVAELFNGSAAAGRTTVTWSGRDANGQKLARGAYFARLTAGNENSVRQLVLLGE